MGSYFQVLRSDRIFIKYVHRYMSSQMQAVIIF